jgi:hypothetical protein
VFVRERIVEANDCGSTQASTCIGWKMSSDNEEGNPVQQKGPVGVEILLAASTVA